MRKKSPVFAMQIVDVHFQELHNGHLKIIHADQIRMACCQIAQGEKRIIPPRWNPLRCGICDVKVDKCRKPSTIHRWKIEKLQKIHAKHFDDVKGPSTYKGMFEKLRQHFVFYHNWPYYEIPQNRIK